MSTPCGECGSENVRVHFDDPELEERGSFTTYCVDCNTEFHVPAEAKSRVRIHALRAIVRDHSAARIDGCIVDAVTASMLVAVYDALTPELREKFGKPDLLRLAEFGWKHTTPGTAIV